MGVVAVAVAREAYVRRSGLEGFLSTRRTQGWRCIRGGMLDGRVRLRLYLRTSIMTYAICSVLPIELEQEGSNILGQRSRIVWPVRRHYTFGQWSFIQNIHCMYKSYFSFKFLPYKVTVSFDCSCLYTVSLSAVCVDASTKLGSSLQNKASH